MWMTLLLWAIKPNTWNSRSDGLREVADWHHPAGVVWQ